MSDITRTIIIGWTRSELPEYSSFSDGYRAGASQHVETIRVMVPDDWDAERIADACFAATNNPTVEPGEGSAEARILKAIYDNGYHGHGAHFSLSVGDTVTAGETMLACADMGWTVVPHFGHVRR